MTRFASILVAGLAAGACLPHPPPPAPPYRAVAQAPADWTLLIDERFVTFIPAGGQPIEQSVPRPIIGIAGEIYQTPRIDVNIVHAPCRDGRSDRQWPDQVQVRVDGRAFNGCGGL